MTPEIKAYAGLIDSHLSQMIDCLRQIPAMDRNWSPNAAAPTPINVAAVTLEWLVADRQHIVNPDPTNHPITDVPLEFEELCDALASERGRWRDLMATLDPATLDDVRYHFGVFPRDVRFMLVHIAQQVIYKNGQLRRCTTRSNSTALRRSLRPFRAGNTKRSRRQCPAPCSTQS